MNKVIIMGASTICDSNIIVTFVPTSCECICFTVFQFLNQNKKYEQKMSCLHTACLTVSLFFGS